MAVKVASLGTGSSSRGSYLLGVFLRKYVNKYFIEFSLGNSATSAAPISRSNNLYISCLQRKQTVSEIRIPNVEAIFVLIGFLDATINHGLIV